MTDWCDDDSLWSAIEPFLFTAERCGEAAQREVDQAAALLGIAPGARVLDLCCGPGRHSLELARRGFAVTGVDRTAAYLDRAARLAADESLSLELVRSDARSFVRPDAFDGAINLYTSFGYFETEVDELAVLANIHASLKPGAAFVIELNGKESLVRRFQPRTWYPNADGTAFLLEEREVRNGWGYIDNCWRVLDASGCREFRFSIRVYSGCELQSLLRRAGFARVSLFGSLAGTRYDHEAERLVAVARK